MGPGFLRFLLASPLPPSLAHFVIPSVFSEHYPRAKMWGDSCEQAAPVLPPQSVGQGDMAPRWHEAGAVAGAEAWREHTGDAAALAGTPGRGHGNVPRQ